MYNVWIVDDEPFILEGLASIVDWKSLQLVLVGQSENGKEALEAMLDQNMKVDILLTDISMPEMNGLDLLKACQLHHPGLKSIILSGFNEFDYVREGMRLGIENYLLKPIDLAELTETLRNTVEKLNRTQMERLSEDQVEMIKDNIMYRWATGRISLEQWRSRADFLNLALEEPYAAAVVFKRESLVDGNEPAAASSLRETVASYLTDGVIPFKAFYNMEEDLVLALGLVEDAPPLALLRRLGEHLHEQLGECPLLALGSVEPTYECMPVSYRHAMVTLDYAMLYPDERLLTYEGVTAGAGRQSPLPSGTQAYAKLMLALDEAAVLAQINSDFDGLVQTEGVQPGDLRDAASEIILEMKRLLKDAQHQQVLSRGYQETITRILQSATLEQLKEQVRMVAREVLDALGERQGQSPVIRQIAEEIQKRYKEEFSLKTLGQLYRVNPVYLGQLFHKEMNQTFSDYLNGVRIEKAIELLRRTSMKTQDIAESVGYWDTAHFYKHFKKIVGVPPTQFRKLS